MKRTSVGALALGVVCGVMAFVTQPAGAEPLPVVRMTAQELSTAFDDYGDAGQHWTGADGSASVALPDGRVVWLFSDTFLGTVNADGSRSRDTPVINNSMVIQEGTDLVDTRSGGTIADPRSLVTPTRSGEYYWVADGTVDNGALKVLYNRYRRVGTGNLDFRMTGNVLASFALPDLTLTSVSELPLGSTIGWGSTILQDGAETYIYGTSTSTDADTLKFAHLARVPTGALSGPWQFWTGSTWSARESDAAAILSGVGTTFGVQRVGGQYVLVTQENNLVFDPQYVAYRAPSPAGPFAAPLQLFTAPEQKPGTAKITYDVHLHPELARDGTLLVSYNVNSLDNDDTFADASMYRPRFVEVAWPRPTLARTSLPAAPGAPRIGVDAPGVATLTWSAVAGATGYRIHRRDVTAGQTHFARLPAAVTALSTSIGGLLDGHTYELRITAENAAGEGPPSATRRIVAPVAAPPAPTR